MAVRSSPPRLQQRGGGGREALEQCAPCAALAFRIVSSPLLGQARQVDSPGQARPGRRQRHPSPPPRRGGAIG